MSIRRTAAAFAVFVLAFALFAPLVTAGASPAQTGGTKKARWTFLYYVAADNNIEGDLLEDVERMAAAGSTADVNIIALIDRSPEDTTNVISADDVVEDGPLLNLPAFTDAKLVKVEKNSLTVIQELGEIDTGDPQTWSWFLSTGMKSFPAEHYAAVIDDHGGAIRGAAWDDSSPSEPDGDGSHLSMSDITKGLQAALKSAKVKKLDIFGFAACLMANFDTAVKLAPFSDYMVASEEITYGRQWNDTVFINAAINNKNATGAELGKAIVDNQEAVSDFFDGRTYSTVDLRKISQVKQAVASFASAVTDTIEQTATPLGRARNETVHFGFISEDQDVGVYDIGDLAAHLTLQGVPAKVKTASNAMHQAVKQATVSVVNGPAAAQATGLSILFPSTPGEMPTDYDSFAASAEWANMLDAYYGNAGDGDGGGDGGGGGNGTAPSFLSPDATIELAEGGAIASADLVPGTEAGVVSADVLCGSLRPDGSVHLVFIAPAVIGAGSASTIAAGWDFSYVQLTDGEVTLDSTVALDPAPAGLRATIPVLYQGPDFDQLEAAVQFVIAEDGSISDLGLFAFDDNGGVAPLTIEEGALIAPLVLVISPGGDAGYELASDQGIDATNLGLLGAALAPGTTFIMALTANDVAGNQALASATEVVPGAGL